MIVLYLTPPPSSPFFITPDSLPHHSHAHRWTSTLAGPVTRATPRESSAPRPTARGARKCRPGPSETSASRDIYRDRTNTTVIQSHMAQKPVLRGEVGCACVAREVSVERGRLINHK